MAAKVEKLLRKRFPTVIVQPHTPPVQGGECLAVFCIPDKRIEAYSLFRMREFPELRERERLPWVTMVPYTESQTREHFPEVWQSARASLKAKASSVSARRSPASPHQPASTATKA